MTRATQLGRYARTIRHLHPNQLVHRARLRAQKRAYLAVPGLTSRAFQGTATLDAGWPATFRPLDARTEARGCPSLRQNLDGTFHLLGQTHELGAPIDWQPDTASQLWRYHLHYFDWAWVAMTEPTDEEARRRFGSLYLSWRDASPVGRWDAWSPYVVALRAWTLCALFEPVIRGTAVETTVRDDLARHARYLRANVEFDVGGNHLIKNLKGLLGLGIFLRDAGLLRFAARHLERQLDRQVLADGGHFERSTSYHAQVLGDLVDVRDLLRHAEVLPRLAEQLDATIGAMQAWLAALLLPDGRLPLLNDAVTVPEARLEALGVRPDEPARLRALERSGYVVGRPCADSQFVIDVGPPCPPELPAHAQADALSVVMDVGGSPLLVDSGTSTYAPGARRQYERSTPAHNTVQIGGIDQTEVWGAFRAGRRHQAWLTTATAIGDDLEVVAHHDGYRHLPGRPIHRRTVRSNPQRTAITDEVEGQGRHDLAVYWHLAPGTSVELVDGGARLDRAHLGPVQLTHEATSPMTVEVIEAGALPHGVVATAHNVLHDAPCLVFRLQQASLPLRIRATFHHDGPTPQPG